MSDLISRQAAIVECNKRGAEHIGYAIAHLPTVQPEKAQLSQEGTTKDAISRQMAIDIERNATVDTNPSHFEAHQKFTQFMDDAEISSFGRWQWSNGFNTALTAVGIDLKKLPSAQPEPHEGHWIGCDGSYICSECNGSPIDFIGTMGISFDAYVETPMNYCPNCGARMKGATP